MFQGRSRQSTMKKNAHPFSEHIGSDAKSPTHSLRSLTGSGRLTGYSVENHFHYICVPCSAIAGFTGVMATS
jgi:hypothetical protein